MVSVRDIYHTPGNVASPCSQGQAGQVELRAAAGRIKRPSRRARICFNLLGVIVNHGRPRLGNRHRPERQTGAPCGVDAGIFENRRRRNDAQCGNRCQCEVYVQRPIR